MLLKIETNIALSVFASVNLKVIICACAMESYYGLESCRSEIAVKTEQLFKAVWDFKPGRVHFGSHVNVLWLWKASSIKSKHNWSVARKAPVENNELFLLDTWLLKNIWMSGKGVSCLKVLVFELKDLYHFWIPLRFALFPFLYIFSWLSWNLIHLLRYRTAEGKKLVKDN